MNKVISSTLGSRARLMAGAILAVSVVSALMFVGCGGSDDGDGGSGNPNSPYVTPNSGGDSRLVNGSGEAWVMCEYDDYDKTERCSGVIFKSNGELVGVSYENEDKKWYGNQGGWSTNGNKLTVSAKTWKAWGGSVGSTVSYNISGDSLTLKSIECYDGCDTEVYIKRNGIVPVMWDIDAKLLTGSGEAWVYCDDDEWCAGYIFASDGYYKFVVKEGDSWFLEQRGEWEAANGRWVGLGYCNTDENDDSYCRSVGFTYSVSGNTITIATRKRNQWGLYDDEIEFEYHTLTKTNGINPVRRLGKSRQDSGIPKSFFKR